MSNEVIPPVLPSGENLRLECVTTCVGFDDLLDVTLGMNMAQVDTMIVVTSYEDRKTRLVAQKHGAIAVPTDLYKKNGRQFNKGAAINAGFSYFQYYGWRMHIDSDIVLPDSFRRMLFNHTHLESRILYGSDRMDVVGAKNIGNLRRLWAQHPQHRLRFLTDPTHDRHESIGSFGGRVVGQLEGYTPIGFFQLWHHSTQKTYPYSLGSAAHDDVMFARLWPEAHRRLLPSTVCYHLCPAASKWGENWEGRKSPRLR